MMPVRPMHCPKTLTPQHTRRPRAVLAASVAMAAMLAAGCATVTPGPFQITVHDTDDSVLEQFQFQAGSQASLESAMIGMCRVYPDATVVAEQLQTHEQLRERCKRSLASMLSVS
ncbi:hypothetical protein [Ralstonia solanacearum]|uniref:hypothetical protein n=1 Tax=Ralstonia solanacearum TaxID=305 RepID=UPI0002EA5AFE|nr:hypothetical protein [Ralstonia solanacearum]AYB54224.1 hypothetical protein C2I38_23050 [Ralstonia solanacearum]AYB58779.1 hypothetical protein C2L97_23005 [Ralstonia solanacearum]AYB63295.1 hypothetical protein C2124_22895 [Ralstonia solanacearum]MBB6592686.1 hypothetical protein [Ralstonia solanacearum]MBB6596910.1 hypothetical protein [Ralstonia solanacearum]